ncbi:hypothetical protein V6N13_002479 [Hibiscus sabdariffa]
MFIDYNDTLLAIVANLDRAFMSKKDYPSDSAINISTYGVNAEDCNGPDVGCCDGKSIPGILPDPKTKTKTKEDLICLDPAISLSNADNNIPKSLKIRDLAPSSNNPQQHP